MPGQTGFGRLLKGVRLTVAAVTLLGWASALAADAVPAPGARELLRERLQNVERDSASWQALLADGKARAEFCARCHGADGNSKTPLVPNLASQNPYYLLDQIERFADGRRKDFIMSPLARQYSREDKVIVSLYYASQPARAQEADPALVARGAALYGQTCLACHGQGARGSDLYARLAGQHPAYLKLRLTAFQQQSGQNSPMAEIAKGLTEAQMTQLSVYLSSLP